MNTLENIVIEKRKLVNEHKELFPVKLLEKSIFYQSKTVSLKDYVLRKDKQGIIAEIKKRSPSKGVLNMHVDVEKTSIGYMQAGASAISVLTDQPFFGGSNEDLITVRKNNFCPVLRKDFIIDEYQVIEARSIGADAILLIASVLTKEEIKRFTLFAQSLGLEVLLEIHTRQETDKISEYNNIIGINNRNLNSMNIDLQNSSALLPYILQAEVKISESGIRSPEDVIELNAQGFDGFLIGSLFMKHSRPQLAFKQFMEDLKQKRHDLCLS
jgi:indole-3-glycerol phosphate synthase